MVSYHLRLSILLSIIILQTFCLSVYAQKAEAPADTAAAWGNYLVQNGKMVKLNGIENFDDLEFLKELLRDKRIVYLGENSYGTAEYTKIKTRLVHYLHEELGYDVIAFEEGACEAFAADQEIEDLPVNKAMTNAINPAWQETEMVPLLRYIQQSKSSRHPITLAGLDILPTPYYSFSHLLYKTLVEEDTAYAKTMSTEDSTIVRIQLMQKARTTDSLPVELLAAAKFYDKDITEYRRLKNYLDERKDHFKGQSAEDIDVLEHYVDMRIKLCNANNIIDKMILQTGMAVSNANKAQILDRYRDTIMSSQLDYLANVIYPGKKIIVWANNSHIEKQYSKMPGYATIAHLGYSIGLFCYQGKGYNWQEPYDFNTPKEAKCLENIMHTSRFDNTFIDLMGKTEFIGNSWMYQNINFYSGDGNTHENDIIRDRFDGILMIKTITQPKPLNLPTAIMPH